MGCSTFYVPKLVFEKMDSSKIIPIIEKYQERNSPRGVCMFVCHLSVSMFLSASQVSLQLLKHRWKQWKNNSVTNSQRDGECPLTEGWQSFPEGIHPFCHSISTSLSLTTGKLDISLFSEKLSLVIRTMMLLDAWNQTLPNWLGKRQRNSLLKTIASQFSSISKLL